MAQETSSIKKPGKYDLVDLIFFIGLALLFDLGSVIPGVGTLGVLAFRMIFYFKNVDTKLINILMGTGGIIEIIPAISVIPAVTLFVIIVFVEVKIMERARKKNPELAAKIDKAASMGRGPSAGTAAKGAATASATAAANSKAGVQGAGSSTAAGGTESPETKGQEGRKRTLPDGSQPAQGSPIAGEETGESAPSSRSAGRADQVSQEKEKQQEAETDATPDNSEAPQIGSGPSAEGGRYPKEPTPLAQGTPSAQPAAGSKTVKGGSEKRVDTSRRSTPQSADIPKKQESL